MSACVARCPCVSVSFCKCSCVSLGVCVSVSVALRAGIWGGGQQGQHRDPTAPQLCHLLLGGPDAGARPLSPPNPVYTSAVTLTRTLVCTQRLLRRLLRTAGLDPPGGPAPASALEYSRAPPRRVHAPQAARRASRCPVGAGGRGRLGEWPTQRYPSTRLTEIRGDGTDQSRNGSCAASPIGAHVPERPCVPRRSPVRDLPGAPTRLWGCQGGSRRSHAHRHREGSPAPAPQERPESPHTSVTPPGTDAPVQAHDQRTRPEGRPPAHVRPLRPGDLTVLLSSGVHGPCKRWPRPPSSR